MKEVNGSRAEDTTRYRGRDGIYYPTLWFAFVLILFDDDTYKDLIDLRDPREYDKRDPSSSR